MARYAISPEGISQLQQLAKSLLVSANEILESSSKLEGVVTALDTQLGVYGDEILTLVNSNRKTLKNNRDQIISLAQLVNRKAEEVSSLLGFTGVTVAQVSSTQGVSGVTDGITSRNALDRPNINSVSQQYLSMLNLLNNAGISHRPIETSHIRRSKAEIVNRIGGGDQTEGSCSSLAFAYAGNIAGYDVLDFRDGASRSFFSRNSSIQMISSLPGVQSNTLYGRDDVSCSLQLLASMQDGKEYYLATGQHASIVRKCGGHFEYLELQSTSQNGWHALDERILCVRFGCDRNNTIEYPNFLIDVESLSRSHEFLDIIGFLNTAEADQNKGGAGHVR